MFPSYKHTPEYRLSWRPRWFRPPILVLEVSYYRGEGGVYWRTASPNDLINCNFAIQRSHSDNG